MNSESTCYTVTGSSYEECMNKIREKHGNYSPSILNKKESYNPGFFGIGKKYSVEIKYTLHNIEAYNNSLNNMKPNNNSESKDAKEKEKILALAREASLKSQQQQMTTIQKQLESVSKKLDIISSETETHSSIRRIEELLETNEFTPSYIRKMVDRIRTEFSLDELDDFDTVQNKVVEWIGEEIEIKPLTEITKRPSVLVLIGPTGVGKTTTVAKLAAMYRLNNENFFIRMITTDRVRIGAKEQLSIYGNIMDIPTTQAESAEDIKKIISMDSGKLDVILIDTTGLSPHDYVNIGKMRSILELPELHPDIYLTVSASTKASDIRAIMRNYEPFDYKAVIITKLDETNHIGNVLSVLSEKNKAVAFISSGQKIRKNLEQASVVRFLMKLADFKIDRESLEKKFSALPEDITGIQIYD